MAAQGIQEKDGKSKDQNVFQDFVELGSKSGDSLDLHQETSVDKWHAKRLKELAYANGTLEFEKRTLEKRVEVQEKEIEELKLRLRIKSITMKQNEELGRDLRILRTEAKTLQNESQKQIAEKDQIIVQLKKDLDRWRAQAELRATNLEREIADLMDTKLNLEKELDSLKLLQCGPTKENQALLKEHEKLKLRLKELLTKFESKDGISLAQRTELSSSQSLRDCSSWSILECCSNYVSDLSCCLETIADEIQVMQKRESVALMERNVLRQKHETLLDEVQQSFEELKVVKVESEGYQMAIDQFSRKRKESKEAIVKLQNETARLSRRLRDEVKEKLYLYTDLQRYKLRLKSCGLESELTRTAPETSELKPEQLLDIMPVFIKSVVDVYEMLNELTKEQGLLAQQTSTLEAAKGIIWDLKELMQGVDLIN